MVFMVLSCKNSIFWKLPSVSARKSGYKYNKYCFSQAQGNGREIVLYYQGAEGRENHDQDPPMFPHLLLSYLWLWRGRREKIRMLALLDWLGLGICVFSLLHYFANLQDTQSVQETVSFGQKGKMILLEGLGDFPEVKFQLWTSSSQLMLFWVLERFYSFILSNLKGWGECESGGRRDLNGISLLILRVILHSLFWQTYHVESHWWRH